MTTRALVFFCVIVMTGVPVRAKVLEGVSVPPEVVVEEQRLSLNGAGSRSFTWGPVAVKIYVAAFYAPEALRSEAAVMKSAGPMQFDFTFLRAVKQSQVAEAWNAQFKASVSHHYDGLAEDQRRFVGCFGALQKFDTQTVKLVGDETRVFDKEVLKGTIAGRNFQRAFLSMWFGAKAVTPELKAALLGQP